jgi:cyanate lyase
MNKIGMSLRVLTEKGLTLFIVLLLLVPMVTQADITDPTLDTTSTVSDSTKSALAKLFVSMAVIEDMLTDPSLPDELRESVSSSLVSIRGTLDSMAGMVGEDVIAEASKGKDSAYYTDSATDTNPSAAADQVVDSALMLVDEYVRTEYSTEQKESWLASFSRSIVMLKSNSDETIALEKLNEIKVYIESMLTDTTLTVSQIAELNELLTITNDSIDEVENPDSPDLISTVFPTDSLDIKYKHLVSAFEAAVDSINEQLTDPTLSAGDRDRLNSSLLSITPMLTSVQAKNPEWYVATWERFGVKSEIENATFFVGFNGFSGSITTDANEQIVLSGNEISDNTYPGSVAIYVDGIPRGSQSGQFTAAQASAYFGPFIAQFLLSNEGFRNTDATNNSTACAAPFSFTSIKTAVNDLLDAPLNYSPTFTASGYQTGASESEILDYFGREWGDPYTVRTWEVVGSNYEVVGSTEVCEPNPLDPVGADVCAMVDDYDYVDVYDWVYDWVVPACEDDESWEAVY